ncbi:MAG TPA: xanthine dehydrogenase family protein subunit M, partial [Thermotogota bacterium]|nr:xanthine dehydrogenase family protein subunit M [Thermotogota bacterium]
VPVRIREGERVLNETYDIDKEKVERVVNSVQKAIRPITDVRGSREYRFAVTAELVRESLSLCQTRIKTEGGGR